MTLLFVAAGRFLWVVATPWFDAETGDVSLPNDPIEWPSMGDQTFRGGEAKGGAPKGGASKDPAPKGGATRGNPAADEASTPTKTGLVRVMLAVSHSRMRSKIFLNGAFIGYTTYMKDLTCTYGEKLTFEIVPPRGPTVQRTVRCASPTLAVSD